MAFDEKNINRDNAGRFDEKPQSAPEVRLQQAGAAPESEATSKVGLPAAQYREDVWHIVRDGDNYYAETFHGTREEAEARAAAYTPNHWTAPEDCATRVEPVEPDYPRVAEYRAGYDAYYARQMESDINAGHDIEGGTCCTFHKVNTRETRESYADSLQRSIAETLSRGRDRREATWGELYAGNDGD